MNYGRRKGEETSCVHWRSIAGRTVGIERGARGSGQRQSRLARARPLRQARGEEEQGHEKVAAAVSEEVSLAQASPGAMADVAEASRQAAQRLLRPARPSHPPSLLPALLPRAPWVMIVGPWQRQAQVAAAAVGWGAPWREARRGRGGDVAVGPARLPGSKHAHTRGLAGRSLGPGAWAGAHNGQVHARLAHSQHSSQKEAPFSYFSPAGTQHNGFVATTCLSWEVAYKVVLS